MKLTALQEFARDMRTLLCTHQGRLTFNSVEGAYAAHFGVALVPASYGYPSLGALLSAIPHVITVRGKGYRRTVLLNQHYQGNGNISVIDLILVDSSASYMLIVMYSIVMCQ